MADHDIAEEAAKVGDALTSVRLDEMLLSLAKGIAWGQFDLDKVGVDVTKMMGVPGSVTIGDERLSMLEAGFLPTFYHFVDTILELKMEVKIRSEEATAAGTSEKHSWSRMAERSGSTRSSFRAGFWGAKYQRSARSGFKSQSKSAYARTVDANHSQKYSQELNATSLMRTKLVPKPAPDVLVERIRLLLERLKAEVERELAEKNETDDPFEKMEEMLMKKLADRFGDL